jgi:hypothetical protein
MRLYIGLLHYPVYNKNNQIIASCITNLDLHDISRVAKTYGVKKFHVITPVKDQQEIARRILKHWTEGYGAAYNQDRKEAIELIEISSGLDESIEKIRDLEHTQPVIVATDASPVKKNVLSYPDARRILREGSLLFLIFGTAWGLTKEVIEKADFLLEPVYGVKDYNHLSVRSAVAIILDRLARNNS